ncbi:helix-turn-helix domain-containing protein [Coprococcus sp. MSK.21.13]|nr:helix-turn-helix domain-containing protein [Clostridium cochlearium]MBU5269531.1 helix-turn-helix domain-containing protein [Clostridium cochlearium]MBV1819964.1 helix-turn-helix domain-containing protein [Bacteroidales bacterium MSK.15.36]NSJ92832.1 helix-turn-helix domain-containing protein [Coprococcus sp. MSK.21.13]
MKNRVEELRKKLNINQEELAKTLRVSRQTISSIENGQYFHNFYIFL